MPLAFLDLGHVALCIVLGRALGVYHGAQLAELRVVSCVAACSLALGRRCGELLGRGVRRAGRYNTMRFPGTLGIRRSSCANESRPTARVREMGPLTPLCPPSDPVVVSTAVLWHALAEDCRANQRGCVCAERRGTTCAPQSATCSTPMCRPSQPSVRYVVERRIVVCRARLPVAMLAQV